MAKSLREKILDELKLKIEKFPQKPSLVVILVGENPASKIYVNNKKKNCTKSRNKFRSYKLSV